MNPVQKLGTRVFKFGGSSVGSAEAFRRSADVMLASAKSGRG
jgi:aspartokinase